MRRVGLLGILLVVALVGCRGDGEEESGVSVPEITAARIAGHLDELERIADENGGTRATGTPGYDASVEHVVDELRAAGYSPTLERFPFTAFRELEPPAVRVVADAPVDLGDIVTMQYSGSGRVAAPLVPVEVGDPPWPTATSSSGCEDEDFADFPAGAVALVQRGGCFLADKARNAADAGAGALLVMNEGTPGRTAALQGTLGRGGIPIPVVGISYEAGAALAVAEEPQVTVRVRAETEEAHGTNVLAERPGSGDEVVLVGGHLDSVAAGPGVNDNGSGVAALLEIARAVQDERPESTLRFAFWGGEELGLLGSTAYVEGLASPERSRIVAVLNLDMIGSGNGGRFYFDDEASPGSPAPEGSDAIAEAYADAFRALELSASPTPLEPGRSDYAPFAEADIAVGGVIAGTDEVKSPEEVRLFGGRAGDPYDPCYHQACDRADGVDVQLVEQMARATALAALDMAERKS